MNKLNFIVLAGFILFLTSCGNKSGDNLKVQGQIDGDFEGNYVELKLLTSSNAVVIDSAQLNGDNFFDLQGRLEIPQFAALEFNNGEIIYLIVKPKDEISITAEGDDIVNTYMVEGSSDSYRIKQLLTNHQKTLDAIADVIIAYRDSLEVKSEQADRLLAERNKKRQELINEHREYTKNFIKDNLASLASLMALYQSIGRDSYVLDIQDDFEYFAMVDSSLTMKYPSSDAVKDLNEMVVAFKEQNKHLTIGKEAPDIALPSPDGDTVLLSSLRGKYVLLDFWASWCSPCREENPYLVSAYKQFNDRGFEIYQVSLDKTKEAWIKGIEEDNLDWVHVSDLQFWNSQAARLYKIREIPSNFLLDPEGKIIARNLRGQQLENTLSEVIN